MAISKTALQITMGVLTGGMLLDDNGLGTILGGAIGGMTASKMNIKIPESSIIQYEKRFVNNGARPLDKLEADVERFKEKLARGSYSLPAPDPNNRIPLDIEDIFNTINTENVQDFVSNATQEEIVRLKNILDAGSYLTDDLDVPGMIVKDVAQKEVYTSVRAEDWQAELDRRFTALESYFTERGYTPEEAADKATLYTSGQDNFTPMSIDRQSHKLTVGNEEYRISTSGYYSDGKSMYGVRRLNLFGDYLGMHKGDVLHPDFEANLAKHFDTYLTSLGVDDEARGVLVKNVKEYATLGMLPEDLERLASIAPKLAPYLEELQERAAAGREFLQNESGMIKTGADFDFMVANPTKRMRDVSNKTSLAYSFNTNALLEFKDDAYSALRKTDTAPSETGSLFHKAKLALQDWLGITNIKDGVGINDTDLVRITGTTNDLIPMMTPEERGGWMARDTIPDYRAGIGTLDDDLLNDAKDTFRMNDGAPEGLETMSVRRRVSVDEGTFNTNNNTGKGLGDGAGIGRSSSYRANFHQLISNASIEVSPINDAMVSEDILKIVSGRAELGVDFNSQKLQVKPNYTHKAKLESYFTRMFSGSGLKGADVLQSLGDLSQYDQASYMNALEGVAKGNVKATRRLRAIRNHMTTQQRRGVVSTTTTFGDYDDIARYLDSEDTKFKTHLTAYSDELKAIGGTKELEYAQLIDDAIANNTYLDEDFQREIREYNTMRNDLIEGRVNPSLTLGIDAGGNAVRVPTIAGSHVRLREMVRTGNDYTFVFQGDNTLHAGVTIKSFGPGSKVNQQLVTDAEFDKTLSVVRRSSGIVGPNTNVRASVITEEGTSGQKAARKWIEAYQAGTDTANLYSPEVDAQMRKLILDAGIAIDDTRALWAVTQLANAVTEGKATNNAALGARVGAEANMRRALTFAAQGDYTVIDDLLKIVGADDSMRIGLTNQLKLDFDNTSQTLLNITVDSADETYAKFTRAGMVEAFLNDTLFSQETLSTFRMAYDEAGVDYMFSQDRSDATALSGAGKRRVNISHFAVEAFREAGITGDLMDAFGTLSDNDRYDLTAFMEMSQGHEGVSLNQHFRDKLGNDVGRVRNFMNTIRKKNPETVRHLIQSDPNVDRAMKSQNFLYLDLEGVNSKTGIKTIPLYLANTNKGGHTQTSGGVLRPSKLTNRQDAVIEAYLDYIDGSKQGAVVENLERLETALVELAEHYQDSFTSSNNAWGKTLFSREAPNSMYNKVVPTSNTEFLKLSETLAQDGHSVVGISRNRAIDLLTNMGVDVDEDTLDDFLDKDRRLVTTPGSSTDFIPATVWREPSYHAMLPFVSVIDDLADEEIVIDPRNKEYAKLMFGDMDDDNIFLAAAKRKFTQEEIDSFNALRDRRADIVKEVLPVAELLGVKGTDKDAYDIYQAEKELQANPDKYGVDPNVRDQRYADALNQLLDERRGLAMDKASLRKIVTPFITNMVVDLLNNPNKPAMDDMAEAMFRTMGNYMVENVIKAAHTDTSSATGAAVNNLLSGYQNYTQALQSGNQAGITQYHQTWANSVQTFLQPIVDEVDNSNVSTQQKALAKKAQQLLVQSAKNPSTATVNSVMGLTSAIRQQAKNGAPNVQQIYNHIANAPQSANLPWVQTPTVNARATGTKLANTITQTIVDNVKANSLPLMLGGIALGVGALVSQKQPDFNGGHDPEEFSGMTLADQNLTTQPILERIRESPTAHVTSDLHDRFKNYSLNMIGEQGPSEQFRMNTHEAIYGNRPSSVRIQSYTGY